MFVLENAVEERKLLLSYIFQVKFVLKKGIFIVYEILDAIEKKLKWAS